ncbi:MAG: helix-turn-helix domain-containing protein [Blautia sp.]|nr:helix-turn-helix domain-containing protein [Blautia sp.]
MGRKSIKENKTVYQKHREREGLTREQAAELLEVVSSDRIERIENERTLPEPADVLRMAAAYHAPELCNYYCSHECPIGKKYVSPVEVSELPNIILETVASLNAMYPLTNRLIEISRDGRISDEEIPDFVQIEGHLEKVAAAVEALQLWVERTVSNDDMNRELLEKYRAADQEE